MLVVTALPCFEFPAEGGLEDRGGISFSMKRRRGPDEKRRYGQRDDVKGRVLFFRERSSSSVWRERKRRWRSEKLPREWCSSRKHGGQAGILVEHKWASKSWRDDDIGIMLVSLVLGVWMESQTEGTRKCESERNVEESIVYGVDENGGEKRGGGGEGKEGRGRKAIRRSCGLRGYQIEVVIIDNPLSRNGWVIISIGREEETGGTSTNPADRNWGKCEPTRSQLTKIRSGTN